MNTEPAASGRARRSYDRDVAVTYYSQDMEGRHLGLFRHRTAGDGSGVEYLNHAGRWMRGRSLGDLLELDQIDAQEAALIARRQYGVSLAGADE